MARHYHNTPYRPRSDGYKKPVNASSAKSDSSTAFVLLVLASVAATFYGVWQLTSLTGQPVLPQYALQAASSDRESASFGLCHDGGGINCVVDGDTLYYRGQKIRIADIDTPETHEPRCAFEAQRGEAATQRLHVLVNAGAFTLNSIDRDEDRFGRKLRIVTRGGDSLGGVLVNEGLARWYGNGRQSWC